jgi:hypothetical protein
MARITNLNVQGMSRRDKSLMSCIVADPGQVVVSSDISSGEPSVLAHYSQDINYRLATVDMIGKQPYLDKSGMLIIDDIYLMVASKYPDWKGPIQDAFHATYDGKTFAEKWLEEPEYLSKKVLGHIRNQAKICCLGISYSMGPKKLVLTAAQNSFDLSLKEARVFYNAYWETFPRVKLLSDKLKAMHSKQGYLINDFGFVLYPDSPHKCLNYLIQSSVTGLMHVFKQLAFTRPDLLEFLVEVHDESLMSVPIDKVAEAKEHYFKCVDELNRMLNWSVKMRFGWVEGKNWYESK